MWYKNLDYYFFRIVKIDAFDRQTDKRVWFVCGWQIKLRVIPLSQK